MLDLIRPAGTSQIVIQTYCDADCIGRFLQLALGVCSWRTYDGNCSVRKTMPCAVQYQVLGRNYPTGLVLLITGLTKT
jgi:hypothetical protein